MTDSRWNS